MIRARCCGWPEAVQVAERAEGCRKLQVAAAWADCHGAPDDHAVGERQSMLGDRFVRMGGLGTPLVVESCPAELARVLASSVVGARQLIGDALTVRHRLPMLWARVVAGEVWAWKARQIAQRTSHLSEPSSREVDRLVSPHVELLAWGRFEKCLDATLLAVDEATYQARAEQAAARLRDLLLRHVDQAADPHHPEVRVAAHLDDPSDPWAGDDLPDAGWETSRHGNYHQPGFDDLDDLDDCWASQSEPDQQAPEDQQPPAEADQVWNDQQTMDDQDAGLVPMPSAFRRVGEEEPADLSDQPSHCPGCGCGSAFDWRPFTTTELNACRTRSVVHVHVTDQTLVEQHGVLRTAYGPVTLDQFRRWLTDADPNLTIRPVLDPAAVAPVDSYEIPLAIREAVATRHPGSIWPHSPATAMTGRVDLDHLSPYRRNGPPGQTRVENLGPLARSEHRPKTVANWQVRHPDQRAYLWRSPHGIISLVTNQGTLLLGDSEWAQSVWHTAQPHQDAA